MPESPAEPPRVRVALPAGTPARLLGWRQDPETGRWWGLVTGYVPADAVRQVDGEDYSQVPREPATGYVLETDTRTTPPTIQLHTATCWEIKQPAKWRRLTPVARAGVAQAAVRFEDTTPCPVCRPLEPDSDQQGQQPE